GHQSPAVATVEGVAQIGERLPCARECRARVPEGADPVDEVAAGVQRVVPGVQIEDRGPSSQSVQYELLLVGHRHGFLLARSSALPASAHCPLLFARALITDSA